MGHLRNSKNNERPPVCQTLLDQLHDDPNLEKFWGHVNGVSLISQLNDPETEAIFKKCLVGLFKPIPTFQPDGVLIEVDLFDTKEKPNHEENTK